MSKATPPTSSRDANAAIGCTQQESAAEAPALYRLIDCEAAEAERGHVVAREAFLHERRRPTVFDRCGAQRIEAENARRRVGRRGDEAFCAAAFMVLARELLQIMVEIGIAAVEGPAIVPFAIGASSQARAVMEE